MPRRFSILFAIFCVVALPAHAARHRPSSILSKLRLSDDLTPAAYELKLVRYADPLIGGSIYVFVIGDVAYRTVESLQAGIAQLPVGSLIQWTPAAGRYGNEPILSNPNDLAALATYCNSLGIYFLFIPLE